MEPISYHVTFRTDAQPVEGGSDVVRVVGSEPRPWQPDREAPADTSSPVSYRTRVDFLSETAFTERGSISFGGSDRLEIGTVEPGVMTVRAGSDERHGAVIWRVVGGTGRFTGATGLVTTNFVFDPESGAGVEEQTGVVFTSAETSHRPVPADARSRG